jgi:hypothetical protein
MLSGNLSLSKGVSIMPTFNMNQEFQLTRNGQLRLSGLYDLESRGYQMSPRQDRPFLILQALEHMPKQLYYEFPESTDVIDSLFRGGYIERVEYSFFNDEPDLEVRRAEQRRRFGR